MFKESFDFEAFIVLFERIIDIILGLIAKVQSGTTTTTTTVAEETPVE